MDVAPWGFLYWEWGREGDVKCVIRIYMREPQGEVMAIE